MGLGLGFTGYGAWGLGFVRFRVHNWGGLQVLV